MFKYVMRAVRLAGNYCEECKEGPTEVEYELLQGPDAGNIYRYCESCADDLEMLANATWAAWSRCVNPRTMRTWCATGRVQAFKGKNGMWKVLVDPHSLNVIVIDKQVLGH